MVSLKAKDGALDPPPPVWLARAANKSHMRLEDDAKEAFVERRHTARLRHGGRVGGLSTCH